MLYHIIHVLTDHRVNTFCTKTAVNIWAETLTWTNRDFRMQDVKLKHNKNN
jgi:hypothetical protein